MYAVIETGGKQYRVEVGTELEVELLDVEPGQSITLDRVLLVADGDNASVGTPVVVDAAVEAEVIGATRGDKVIAFKYRPKARRRVMKGHRQDLTMLRIADIRLGGKSAADSDKKSKASKADERQRVAEAAARQAAEDAALAAKLNVAAPEPETAKAKPAAKAKPVKVEDVTSVDAATTADTTAPDAAATADAAIIEPTPDAEAEADAPVKKTRARAVKADAVDAEPAGEAGDAAVDEAAESDDTAGTPKKGSSRTKKDE
jgi:large subunit ribosomal protein L21